MVNEEHEELAASLAEIFHWHMTTETFCEDRVRKRTSRDDFGDAGSFGLCLKRRLTAEHQEGFGDAGIYLGMVDDCWVVGLLDDKWEIYCYEPYPTLAALKRAWQLD